MGRPKGIPKTGGRKVGVPNKITRSMGLEQMCVERGINLFEKFLDFIQGDDKQLAFAALREAAKYVYPQKRAIEHSGNIDQRILTIIADLNTLPTEQLKQIIKEEANKEWPQDLLLQPL